MRSWTNQRSYYVDAGVYGNPAHPPHLEFAIAMCNWADDLIYSDSRSAVQLINFGEKGRYIRRALTEEHVEKGVDLSRRFRALKVVHLLWCSRVNNLAHRHVQDVKFQESLRRLPRRGSGAA
jgi:SOS response regulatory protein OraA/RecX